MSPFCNLSGSYEVVRTMMERRLDVHAFDKQGGTGRTLCHCNSIVCWEKRDASTLTMFV